MRFLLLLLSSLAMLISTCRVQVPSADVPSFSVSLQAVLDSIYQLHPNAVGIMAHVEAPDQNISWSGATGFANKDTKKELEADMPALIASNTKTYVAAAILRLVERGKLQLDQPLRGLLPSKYVKLFTDDGYDFDQITVAHLLSHTSGIFDYVSAPSFFAKLEKEPAYRWSQEEQITLAIDEGEPLGEPGGQFVYADTNYLLLAAILSEHTNQPFYLAIRSLLNFEKHALNATWFHSLEPSPDGLKPLAYQYDGEFNTDSYAIDPSFDLYGGGGLAATTEDLARFSQLLFNRHIFAKDNTLDLIYTRTLNSSKEDSGYYLGIAKSEIDDRLTYGHYGFWGTVVQYFPDLNASISVFILERAEAKLRVDVLEGLVNTID